MIKQTLALAGILALVGCASESSSPSSSTTSQQQQARSAQSSAPAVDAAPSPAELAAYAGRHPYPGGTPARNDLRAAAIVNADQGIIKIYNFGTHPISDADVWVNQAFVRHINAIAPESSVTLQTSNLYNSVGQQFSARGEHVNLVQVESDHDLQTLMGPAPQ